MNTRIQHIDKAKHPPTIEGAFGAAWAVDLEAARTKSGEHQTAACWIVYAPHAHPLWAYYCICAVHLRTVPGVAAPKTYIVGATHELMVAALDPEHAPDPTDIRAARWLQPLNFAAQWVQQERNPVDADKAAAQRIYEVVLDILGGKLNPDTDARRQWIARFGNNMILD